MPYMKTLPGQYFSSPDIFQQEQEYIFCNHWIHVGRVEKIPNTGDFFLHQLANESIIVLRDQEGQIRAYHNFCRHRGTRLCSQESGRFRKTIQCPYHAWTYGLDGHLMGVPSGQFMPDFNKDDFPLLNVHLKVWEGCIFLNLAADPIPFDEVYGDALPFLNQWQLGALATVHQIEYDIRANWKVLAQNFSECYHCPAVHPEFSTVSHFESGANLFLENHVLGGSMFLSDRAGSASLSGKRCGPPIDTLGEKESGELHFYVLFPNTLLILAPDHAAVYTLKPQSPSHTLIHSEYLFHPETISQPNFNPDDIVQLWDVTNLQDWAICEQTQLGLQSKAYQPGPYYEWHESVLAAFDQRVLDALGHERQKGNKN